jgi:UDP:flavonoid glycosyltransferase YjiC (YdhE family)
MVPLARALEAAGHDVAFATAERFCRRVVLPAGFAAFPAGVSPLVVDDETMRLPEVADLGPRDVWELGAHMFARVAAAKKVPDLARIVEEWRPALVVHGAIDFAGPIAAARGGIPSASHSIGALQPGQFWRLSGELVAPTWRQWGLEPDPLGGMFRFLYLDICPPSFQATDIHEIPTARPLRPVPFDAPTDASLPPWVDALADLPTVYVTLGTIFNGAPGVFEVILEGLKSEPFNVVVTVGEDRDPDELGPQPDNVHVERYIPQSLLFPHCDAVVCHGGSGTTLAAFAHGLPVLVVPQGANQFWNADRCAELGVGRCILDDDLSPEAVRRDVHALLEQPGYRSKALQLRREIERMPSPEANVALLERLAEGGGGDPVGSAG